MFDFDNYVVCCLHGSIFPPSTQLMHRRPYGSFNTLCFSISCPQSLHSSGIIPIGFHYTLIIGQKLIKYNISKYCFSNKVKNMIELFV